MIFKLAEAAEKSWRRLNGHNQLPKLILGVDSPTEPKSLDRKLKPPPPDPVRNQDSAIAHALDRTCTNADCIRHHGGGPMGRHGGRVALGEHHDTLSDIRAKWRDARWPPLIAQQAVVPCPA
jgi:hypothetical protein